MPGGVQDERVRAIEEDIYHEVEGRYELHRRRLGDIDVNHLLKAGTSGPSATASAPTSHKVPTYKPVEAFRAPRRSPGGRSVTQLPELRMLMQWQTICTVVGRSIILNNPSYT